MGQLLELTSHLGREIASQLHQLDLLLASRISQVSHRLHGLAGKVLHQKIGGPCGVRGSDVELFHRGSGALTEGLDIALSELGLAAEDLLHVVAEDLIQDVSPLRSTAGIAGHTLLELSGFSQFRNLGISSLSAHARG